MAATEHPFAYLRKRADVKRCCGDPKNLFVTTPAPSVQVAHCTVCGRKHRKLTCEPGSMLARGFDAMLKAKANRPAPRLILPGDPDFK